MGTPLTIQSIVTNNKIYAQFSNSTLPKFARQGELYVVDGILYIYSTLEGNGVGRWFPLTDHKDVFKYDQTVVSNEWHIPVKWLGDDVQYIIYDQNDKVYTKHYNITTNNQMVIITFETAIKGTIYIISKTLNKNFNIGSGKFIVAEDLNNKGSYYISLDTEYITILSNGSTTFKKDVTIHEDTTLKSNLYVEKNIYVSGNTSIEGDLTIKGNKVDINATTLNVSDNILTLNNGASGFQTKNIGLEADRGSYGILPILTFNELDGRMTIPVKSGNDFIQDEIAGTTFTLSEINKEYIRSINVENILDSRISTSETDIIDINNNITIISQEIGNLNNILDNEISRALDKENKLQNDITLEINARTDLVNELNSKIDLMNSTITISSTTLTTTLSTEISTILELLDGEITRATSQENTLQSNIDIEKGRIDSILSASTADKDSFKEIVDLINSVDTTNDTTFAGYVLSNDTRSTNIEKTISNLTLELDSQIQTVTDYVNGTKTLIFTNMQTDKNELITEINNVTNDLILEKNRALASESLLESKINALGILNDFLSSLNGNK